VRYSTLFTSCKTCCSPCFSFCFIFFFSLPVVLVFWYLSVHPNFLVGSRSRSASTLLAPCACGNWGFKVQRATGFLFSFSFPYFISDRCICSVTEEIISCDIPVSFCTLLRWCVVVSWLCDCVCLQIFCPPKPVVFLLYLCVPFICFLLYTPLQTRCPHFPFFFATGSYSVACVSCALLRIQVPDTCCSVPVFVLGACFRPAIMLLHRLPNAFFSDSPSFSIFFSLCVVPCDLRVRCSFCFSVP